MSRTHDTLKQDDGPTVIDNLRVSLGRAEDELRYAQRWACEAAAEELDDITLASAPRQIALLRTRVLSLLEQVSH